MTAFLLKREPSCFRTYFVWAMKGRLHIIRSSCHAGCTTACWQIHETMWGAKTIVTFLHAQPHIHTRTQIHTPSELMKWKWPITPHPSFPVAYIVRPHTAHTNTCMCMHLTPRHIFTLTHTPIRLGKQTILCCLFMNSSVSLQTGRGWRRL